MLGARLVADAVAGTSSAVVVDVVDVPRRLGATPSAAKIAQPNLVAKV